MPTNITLDHSHLNYVSGDQYNRYTTISVHLYTREPLRLPHREREIDDILKRVIAILIVSAIFS
jgi:hypothetical protein